ncbi:MAG: hypothetical protein II843_01450 [Alphaproteobacteria bacterium]|nr:hypothetical protein [Alphaproteobacteria bacterium]
MPWEFVEYIDPDNQHWGLNQCGDIVSDSSYSAHYTRKNATDSVHRVYEPEQCTGLKDKNGNLIYENDYVKDKDGDIYLVKWDTELVQFNATGKDNCGFETITPFMKGETDELKIIGNIHEQAEQKDK